MKRFKKQLSLFDAFKVFETKSVAVIAGVFLFVLIIGGSGAWAAQEAEPGDTLYPMKLASERIIIFVSVLPEAKARLHMKYADRRLGELEKLYEKQSKQSKRHAQVSQRAIESLERAQQFIDAMDKRHEHLQKRLQKRFELLKQRQQLLNRHLGKNTFEILKAVDVPSLTTQNSSFSPSPDNRNEYKLDIDNEEVGVETHIEIEGTDEKNVEINYDVNNGQITNRTRIKAKAKGGAIRIRESSTINASSSQSIRMNKEDINP